MNAIKKKCLKKPVVEKHEKKWLSLPWKCTQQECREDYIIV